MNRYDILTQLKEEIERTDKKTERECGELLGEIIQVLLTVADGNTTYVQSELICAAGRVDIIVFAEARIAGGASQREAYIWELKAPQVSLFDYKTQSQAQPSVHLYSAETQLMYYYYSVYNDDSLLRRWGILSPDHIKWGGIIIGRDKNLINCKGKNETLSKQLASQAREIRHNYIYKNLDIRLWTWDYVLHLAESQSRSHQKIPGDPDAKVDSQSSSFPTSSLDSGSQ